MVIGFAGFDPPKTHFNFLFLPLPYGAFRALSHINPNTFFAGFAQSLGSWILQLDMATLVVDDEKPFISDDWIGKGKSYSGDLPGEVLQAKITAFTPPEPAVGLAPAGYGICGHCSTLPVLGARLRGESAVVFR